MARSTFTLALEQRAKTGTTGAAGSRREGKVPGVLYGHGSGPLAVAADARAFDELLHDGGRTHLLNITIDGGAKDTALVRDVQRDPISRRVLHVDLQRVRANEEITATLPLVTVGVADGVKNFGGVMDVVIHSVEVTAPANAIPEHLEADVARLGIHDHFLASDLVLPPKVKLATEPSTILISIEPSRVELEVAEADAAAADLLAEQAAEAQAEAGTPDEPSTEGDAGDDAAKAEN